MADRNYLQIPGTVWWGLRDILKRSPNTTINEQLLSFQLGVQDAAARQYLSELRRAGLVSDDGKATSLGSKWRNDDTYAEAVEEILRSNYPPALLELAPPQDSDRQRVASWFVREGLGTGTANNKAATYLLIGSKSPNEAPNRTATRGPSRSEPKVGSSERKRSVPPDQQPSRMHRQEVMPLNINIQIHISADATTSQIDSIFSAMRQYLYDNPNPQAD